MGGQHGHVAFSELAKITVEPSMSVNTKVTTPLGNVRSMSGSVIDGGAFAVFRAIMPPESELTSNLLGRLVPQFSVWEFGIHDSPPEAHQTTQFRYEGRAKKSPDPHMKARIEHTISRPDVERESSHLTAPGSTLTI